MKKYLCIVIFILTSISSFAQDSISFKGYIYNEEYQVYIKMNLYDNNITVPNQDIYGKLPGYFGSKRDGRLWLITDAKLISPTKAELSIINDYGSEDLKATLSINKDRTYTLSQENGSRIKIAVNRKWVKIPTKLVFRIPKYN